MKGRRRLAPKSVCPLSSLVFDCVLVWAAVNIKKKERNLINSYRYVCLTCTVVEVYYLP